MQRGRASRLTIWARQVRMTAQDTLDTVHLEERGKMAETIRSHRRYAGALAALLLTLGVAACEEDTAEQAETPAEEPAEDATESGG